MKPRPRIYYTESQKKSMWDHWQKGDSLSSRSPNYLNETAHRYSASCRDWGLHTRCTPRVQIGADVG